MGLYADQHRVWLPPAQARHRDRPPIYTSCPSADPAPSQRTRLRAAKREGRLTPGRTELRRLARQPESAYANHGRHAPL